MKSHSKRILSLVFALLMLFQQVLFAAQTVDLFNPELGAKTVDLIPGEDDTNTVDLLTPSEEDSTKTVDLLNPEQPSATIEQQKPIIEKNENKTVDTITPRGDDIVPAEGKKSTTTIVVGGDEIEEGETNENSEISPEEIILPEEKEKEEKKDAAFEDEEHHENAGVLPWSTDLVKPWSIYRAPKTVYRPGEDLDLTELLVEIKTGRSGSLYNIEDLINDEFTTITRTRKSDGQKVRLDDKIYEDETMTIHMDGCQDLTIDFTVDENLKDETKAFEAFQQNLIREEFRNGLDFSLYLIKKGEKENPVVAYSLDPHKLTPIGNGVDKKLKNGPLFDLKDINSWDRYDIETIGKVKAILERSAETKDTENIRKKLITQLAIWNVTSNIIPEEIDATVSEPTEIAPELKPADETKETPEEDKKEEPIEITEPTTPEEETENIEKEDEKVEDTKDETVEIKTQEKVEEKIETEENKESEKIEEKAPVQSTVHKIVFNAKEIDVPYDDIELSDEEYELYKELTSLEPLQLKNEDEDLKIYEPLIIEETENQYADLVTIGATDIESIERIAAEATFDAVDYSFQNLYHTLETSSMLGFGQPRDFNVLLKATMKASRKIVKGDKFEVEILSKTLPILNGEEGRANDIQIDGKVVATAEYIAEEHKIVYTFVEDLDTDKVEIEQEFKQIKEEKAALLNMLDVSENLVLDAVRGAEGDEDSKENPDELEISPEDDNAAIKLVLGNTPVQYNGYSFETKKFRLKTTMTAKAAPVWQIPIDWTFDVNIGPYLKPDPKNPLKSLYDPNNPSVEVARPKYDPDKHVITYTFIKPLNNTKTFNIDQLLAFDTDKIANREEIEINIVIAPKNYKVQKMPTIKVRKDDPRSEIISQFVVENKQDLYKVVYPYMVSYVSRQSVNNGTVTWDIDVDTSTLKREGLDYNNIALSLYIPNKQGLSDYKVYVDGTEGAFNTIGDLVLFNKTISKNNIPDNLKIKVQAQTSVERDAYSLGIRITPDTGYIKKLREELKQRIKDKNSILGPLLTLIEFIEDPNNSTQFDDGFNLLDTRITAIAPPENGSERAVGYNDSLRSFYLNKTNNGKVDIKISETIDLKNINSVIGSEIYTNKIPTNNIGISTQNLSIIARGTPVVKIYIPKIDGSYELVSTLNNGKPTETQFNKTISDLRAAKRLLPGTIIEYDYSATYVTGKEFISMGIDLNKREVYNEHLLKYTEANKFAEAKLINIGNKQDTYRVGKYVFKADDEKYNKYVLFKIIETGENGYCVNPGIPNPTGNTHFHKKVVVEPGEGIIALENAIDKYEKQPRNYTGVALLKRLKKIFFYYDKYEREHNLDVINDEDTKYQIRNARQAAIFDAVCNKGKDFLDQGFNNGNAVADSETRRYYNELNNIIDNEPDLTEEQLNSVTITLYPVADNKRIQNIITGEVENPVYIEKVGQDGEPLFGAEFVIIQNGIEVKRWISDGQAKELYLEPGEYILRETKAPDGYKVIDDVRFIVDKIVTVNDIKISRTDTFNKYYSSQERYTDNVIKIESNDNITISSDGHTLKAINKKNSFKLRKVDGTDESKLLKNAEFALYKIIDSGNSTTREEFVETRTTDESGEIEFAGLDTGSYILKENMAPEGYKKIDEFLYVDVQKNGEISFRSANKNGSLEKSYYEVIKGNPIQKQVKYTELKSKKEHSTIEYHGDFKDYLNMKTQVISQDMNTVKSRIILNPSTDSTNGKGPDQPTYLTLTKNTANKLKYKVYKVLTSNKDSIDTNVQVKAIESYPEVEVNGTSKEIFFDTTPTRWNGDAYVIDVTAFYDEMNVGTSAERNISYKWGNKPTPTVAENYLAGEVGVSVKCYEKTVLVPTPPIVKVKNYKTYDFKIEKVDSKVDENGNLIYLQGAEFTLYEFSSKEETERKVVKTVTTDENGIAEFKDIKIGKYILKETKAPNGYKATDRTVEITVGDGGKISFGGIEKEDKVFKEGKTVVERKVKTTYEESGNFEQGLTYQKTWDTFMNIKSTILSSDKNNVKTRIYLNSSMDPNRGNGPDKVTVFKIEEALNANNPIITNVYKVPKVAKGNIDGYLDGYFKNNKISSLIPPEDEAEIVSNTEIEFSSLGDPARWNGVAYVIDVEASYKAPNPNLGESITQDRYIKYKWYCKPESFTFIEGKVGTQLNVSKNEVDPSTPTGNGVESIIESDTPTLQVINQKSKAKVTIVKVDEDNPEQKLSGAVFKLLDKDGKKILKEATTGKDGKATFEDLEPGTYTIIEESAPKGYELTNKTWTVVVGEGNKVEVTENSKVYKTVFGIDNPNTTAIGTWNYTYYQKPVLNVKPVIEQSGDGYIVKVTTKGLAENDNRYSQLDMYFDTEHFEFEDKNVNDKAWSGKYVYYNSNPYTYSFKFKPKADVKVGSYKPITGIMYVNFPMSHEFLPTFNVKMEDGQKESKPVGFNSDGNGFSFNVSNKYKGYEVKFEKICEENGNEIKLPGAKFNLQIKNGEGYVDFNPAYTAISDAEGKIKFSDLKPGEYKVVETDPPAGYYVLNKDVKFFKIDDDGNVFIKENGEYKPYTKDNAKILNSKPGDGKFKILKTDENNKGLQGVKFNLYNSRGDSVGEFTTDEKGEINFTNLPYDKYYVKEISTIPGYIVDGEVRVVLIGKKWEKGTPTGRDVSNKLILNSIESKMTSIINDDFYITPNNSEVIQANLKFKVNEGTKIQPGDTFKVVASENVDLDGIGRSHDDEYDIYGPAGLLATAKIDDETRREITYTFTEYAKYYNIKNINIGMLMAVNRIAVPGDEYGKKNIDVSVTVGTSKLSQKFDVKYNYGDDVQVNACLVKYIEGSNDFVANFYINHNNINTYGKMMKFTSNSEVAIQDVQVKYLNNDESFLPWSFGIRDNEPYLTNMKPEDYSVKKTNNGVILYLNGNYVDNRTYRVVVKGKVIKPNEDRFALYGEYTNYNTWNQKYYQKVGLYKSLKTPDSSATGDIIINVPNYKNKIEYTKVDGTITGTAIYTKPEDKTKDNNKPMSVSRTMFSSQENPLQGAKFVLKKDGSDTALDGSERKSDENGKFSWEGLAPGKYEVWETETPSEYSKPKNPVSSFEVNDKGEIVVTSKDNTTIIKNYKKPNIEFKKVDGKKVDGQNAQVPLADAVFTLKKAKTNKDGSFVRNSDKLLEFEDVIREVVVNGKNEPVPYTATSDANGLFNFKKLEDGIYAVKETKAPKDYAMLLDYVFYFKVEGTKIYRVNKLGEYVDDTKDKNIVPEAKKDENSLIVNMESGKAEVKPIQIENFKVEYPATGGVGALPFVFIGMMIMMAGAYMFIRRRDALYE